jgi:hypothetical protein
MRVNLWKKNGLVVFVSFIWNLNSLEATVIIECSLSSQNHIFGCLRVKIELSKTTQSDVFIDYPLIAGALVVVSGRIVSSVRSSKFSYL